MNPMIFQDTVRSKQEIHVLCGYPSEVVNHKAVQRIDEPKRKLAKPGGNSGGAYEEAGQNRAGNSAIVAGQL